MEEETVKIQIEVPKSQISLESSQEAQPTQQQNVQPKPEPKAEVELQKLREEVAKRNESPDSESPDSGADKLKTLASSPVEALPLMNDKSPPNAIQKILVVVGVSIAVIGIILWPIISFTAGISVAIIGALITAAATLIKIGG